MRIVILSSSVYSETACAMAVRLADAGYPPVGALSLSALNREIFLRKLGQWGVRGVVEYARLKVASKRKVRPRLQNRYLQSWLQRDGVVFTNLNEIANLYSFQVSVVKHQNSGEAIARLKEWSPDLIIFSGGNILREPILNLPRLGVLNVHLGLLPEIRGMSSPEWSLLKRVPVGITIHYMDEGIDTGPILRRCEYSDFSHCDSLIDLRQCLIAFGIEKLGAVVADLAQGTLASTPQCDGIASKKDNQHFVMHEWLQAKAADALKTRRGAAGTATIHE